MGVVEGSAHCLWPSQDTANTTSADISLAKASPMACASQSMGNMVISVLPEAIARVWILERVKSWDQQPMHHNLSSDLPPIFQDSGILYSPVIKTVDNINLLPFFEGDTWIKRYTLSRGVMAYLILSIGLFLEQPRFCVPASYLTSPAKEENQESITTMPTTCFQFLSSLFPCVSLLREIFLKPFNLKRPLISVLGQTQSQGGMMKWFLKLSARGRTKGQPGVWEQFWNNIISRELQLGTVWSGRISPPIYS